jgi:GTP-binding protein HflX
MQQQQQYSTNWEPVKNPRLVILNKVVKISNKDILEGLSFRYKDAITVSAKSGIGLEELKRRMETELGGLLFTIRLPASRTDLAALIHRSGTSVSEEYTEDSILLKARLPEQIRIKLEEFIYEE